MEGLDSNLALWPPPTLPGLLSFLPHPRNLPPDDPFRKPPLRVQEEALAAAGAGARTQIAAANEFPVCTDTFGSDFVRTIDAARRLRVAIAASRRRAASFWIWRTQFSSRCNMLALQQHTASAFRSMVVVDFSSLLIIKANCAGARPFCRSFTPEFT
jgi:hypothetical protein